MTTFDAILSSVESQFAKTTWTDTGIAAFPVNFSKGDLYPEEFVKIELLPSTGLNMQYGSAKQRSGTIIIQIYTAVNTGLRRVTAIADLLDSLFYRKLLQNNVQTFSSSIQIKEGNDADNPSLYRADYVVPFSVY